jgi:hypothetical protein
MTIATPAKQDVMLNLIDRILGKVLMQGPGQREIAETDD